MNIFYKNLLLICILASPFLCKAQFGYVGAGVGLRNTTFHKGQAFLNQKTKYSAVSVEINGMYRPLRFLGIGATIGLPVHQSSRFSFANAETTSGDTFKGFGAYGFGTNNYDEFIPKKFEYSFKQSMAVTFKARIYAAPNVGVYLDFRLTMMALTEKFVIQRDSDNENIVENYSHEEDMSLLIPGFGMGIHNHISHHIYIDLSANFDFMSIENTGFSKVVAYTASNDNLRYVTFKEQIGGSHTSFVFQFSLGYLF